MAEGDDQDRAKTEAKFGQGFLTDIWYFAALSSDLKPGKLARHEILGEPVLLGPLARRASSSPCATSARIAPRRCRPAASTARPRAPRRSSAPTTAGGSARTAPARRSPRWSTTRPWTSSRIRVRRYPVRREPGPGVRLDGVATPRPGEPDRAAAGLRGRGRRRARSWSTAWTSTPTSTTPSWA